MKKTLSRAHRLRLISGVSIAASIFFVLPVLAASASLFVANIVDSSNTFSSGTLEMSGATTGPVTCLPGTGPVSGNNSTVCLGNPLPSGPLTTSASSATTTLSSIGSLNGNGGLLSSTGCGVQQLVDGSVNTDTAVAYGGLSYGVAGPQGGLGVAFGGSTGQFSTVNLLAGPTTFTQLAWFKTTASGSIFSFANTFGTTGLSGWDRMIWVDPTGHVVAGVYPGSIQEVTSPGTYNDGVWHLVAVTLSAAGFHLYVDGSLVASNSGVTTAQGYSGYWHIGWSNARSGWTDAPSSAYFAGSLAGVAVLPVALSVTQVLALYSSANFSSFSSAVSSYSPSSSWMMQDSGTVPYTGVIPGVGGGTTYADSSSSGNTATPQGGNGAVTASPTGPLGGTSVSLNGSSGWLQTQNLLAGPTTFTQLAWFKTTASGSIFSFANTFGTTGLSGWDRMIWVDPTGHVVAGVYPGSIQEVTSPGTYNDGVWHLVAVTLSAAGFHLYVDGSLVASNSGVTTAQGYSGYWHIGWSNARSGWTDAPSSAYFAGSLAGVAVLPVALSVTQVLALYSSANFSSFSSAVSSYSPSALWTLQSAQAQAGGCAQVEVTVQATRGATTTCVVPSGSGACPAPSSAVLASNIGSNPMPNPSASSPVTLLTSMSLTSTAPAAVTGLHLIVPLTYSDSLSSFSAELSYPAGVVVP